MTKEMLTNKLTQNEAIVCVVGLGYVGLPRAKNFSFTKKPLLKKQLNSGYPVVVDFSISIYELRAVYPAICCE